MALLLIFKSLALGSITGFLYGFLMTKKTLPIASETSGSSKGRFKSNSLSFFFMALARMLCIALLWNYILHRTSLDIILVLVSFLASFWLVVIKKKV